MVNDSPKFAQPTIAKTTVDDYPIVWLNTPHLDLDTPDGTFIRGIVESSVRSFQLSTPGLFPGFDHASPDGYYNFDESRGAPRYKPPHTMYIWAVPLSDVSNPPATSDTIGASVTCYSTPGTGQNNSIKAFTYHRGNTTPPTRQRGTHPAPATNVFGNWQVIDIISPAPYRSCEIPPIPLPHIHTNQPGWPANNQ